MSSTYLYCGGSKCTPTGQSCRSSYHVIKEWILTLGLVVDILCYLQPPTNTNTNPQTVISRSATLCLAMFSRSAALSQCMLQADSHPSHKMHVVYANWLQASRNHLTKNADPLRPVDWTGPGSAFTSRHLCNFKVHSDLLHTCNNSTVSV